MLMLPKFVIFDGQKLNIMQYDFYNYDFEFLKLKCNFINLILILQNNILIKKSIFIIKTIISKNKIKLKLL